jgi:putative ABC transport system permease protein
MAGSAETTIMGAIVFLVGAVAAAPGLVLPASRLFQPLLTLWFSREGDIARGNMTRQPGRAAITASTLMIGLATFILMAAVVNSFSDLIDRLLDGFFVNDVVIMPNAIGSYSSIVGADPAVVDEIRSLPDVDTVSSVQHAASSKDGERLEIYGIDPAVYSRLTPMVFTRGDSATAYAELPQGRNAILNPVSALVLGVDVGDTFELQTLEGVQTYHVVGVASDYLNFKIASVFISQDNLHADFQSDEAIMIMVTARDGADVTAVTNEIKQIMQAYPQFTVEESSSYQAELREVSRFSMRSMYFLGLLILIPATLGLLNTLTINVLERTREIGIVRAIGGDRKQIQRMILAEALLLCLFGAAIGVVVGVALSYAFTMGLSLIGWELDYIFPLMGIIAAIVIAVLLALFSSILPARNAARLDIIRALQYE